MHNVHTSSYLVAIRKSTFRPNPIASDMATRFFGDGGGSEPRTPDHVTATRPVGAVGSPAAHLDRAAGGAVVLTEVEVSPGRTPIHDRRLALLIGNGAYPGGSLRNPRNDVDLLSTSLRGLGFEVEVVHDAGKAVLEHAIVAFGARLAEAGSGSLALFYFAGHGIQHQGQNYLVPVDARIPDIRFLRSGAVRLDFLVEELSQSVRRANVVVLDACRNNPIRAAASGAETLRGLAAVESVPDATAIVFSTSAGTEAADGDGDNSPYAAALARALVQPDATLQSVVFGTAAAVVEASGGRQRPALFVQGALPDFPLAKVDTTAPAKASGPWGRLPVDATLPSDATSDVARWRMPDPVLTIERAFPASTLRYGLTARDWEQGHPGDLVNEVLSTGRWTEVDRGWAVREPYAAALTAIRNVFAMRPEWGAPDHDLAARAAMVGAEAGIRQALVVVGWLHQIGGGGFPRDPAVDRTILGALAGRGYRYAQLQYGIMLAQGVDRAPEPAEAIGWLEQAAEKGAYVALYEIGKLYTDTVRVPFRLDLEKAQHYLERASAAGHASAASLLATLHLDRKLARSDQAEALRLLELAAGAGEATALYRRGVLFEHGDGVVPSLDRALRDYEAAAGAGSIEAMLALGYHATFGNGDRPPDLDAAVRWTRLAADKGSAIAQVHLGRFHETGFGVPANTRAAVEHYRAAAPANPMGRVGLARVAIRTSGSAPDTAAVRRELEPVLAGSNDTVRDMAVGFLRDLEVRATLAAAPTLTRLEDISEGEADAPVTIVVWQSLASEECAALHRDVLPRLRDRFVGPGHAQIVYRDAMLEKGAGAAVLVRAAARSQQLAVMQRLVAAQSEWSQAEHSHAALARVLADLGYDESRVWKDSSDPAVISPVLFMAAKLAAELGVRAVPTLFVNGRRLVRPKLAEAEAAVLCALPPEIAFEINGGSTFGMA